MDKNKYELIVSIVARGYSDYIIDATRAAGATGGTIVFGRGTMEEAKSKSFMGMDIQPEKDIVLTLVNEKSRKQVMQAITSNANISSSGHGILFSLPVSAAVGVRELEKYDK